MLGIGEMNQFWHRKISNMYKISVVDKLEVKKCAVILTTTSGKQSNTSDIVTSFSFFRAY